MCDFFASLSAQKLRRSTNFEHLHDFELGSKHSKVSGYQKSTDIPAFEPTGALVVELVLLKLSADKGIFFTWLTNLANLNFLAIFRSGEKFWAMFCVNFDPRYFDFIQRKESPVLRQL